MAAKKGMGDPKSTLPAVIKARANLPPKSPPAKTSLGKTSLGETSPATRAPATKARNPPRAAETKPGASTRLKPTKTNTHHLAQLDLWTDKNALDGDIPIYANVNIGPILIDAAGRHYRMFIRSATLGLDCVGYQRVAETKAYNRKLGKDEARAHVERVQREETKSSWKAKVRARFGWGGASLGGEAGREKNAAERRTSSSEATIELVLIQNLPYLRWRAGDAHLGDIRKMQGFLEGDYFYHDDPEKVPLCHVRATGDAKSPAISASLSVNVTGSTGVHIVREKQYASDTAIPGAERDDAFIPAFKERLRSLLIDTCNGGADLVIAHHRLVDAPSSDGDF